MIRRTWVPAVAWGIAISLLLAGSVSCAGPAAPVSPASRADQPDQSWREQPPGPGRPGVLTYPAAEVHELDNGLRVWLLRRPAGVVSLSVVAKRRVDLLVPSKSGRAALTTRMLTESTRRRSALELAEAVEDLGSSLEHEAGRDYCRVSLLTLAEDVGQGLELLAEATSQPAFDPQELERVRAEWIDGLRAERQGPMRLASLAGLRLLHGELQGAPVSGSVPDVAALSVADLADFHARAFVPDNSALVVVGDVDWPKLAPLVQAHFGAWHGELPETKPAPPSDVSSADSIRIALVDRPDAVQSVLFVAQALPARSAPGHEARQILSSLLGGLFTSRINRNLREEHGYTYGAYSRAIATRYWGAFVVTAAVQTEHTAAALKEILAELRQAHDPALGHPIEDAEVARAKAELTSSLAANLQSVEGVADDVTELFTQGLPVDYHARFSQRLASITTHDVQQEARAHLTPDRLIVVVVGDRSRIEANLRGDGVTVQTAGAQLLE